MKVRSDGHLSSEVFIYVDDGCIIAYSDLVCWQAEIVFLYLQLTRNSRCIQETDRTLSHSGPLVGNSGVYLKQGISNHSNTS